MDTLGKDANARAPLGWLDRALGPVYAFAKATAAVAALACAVLSTADILSTWLFHHALLGVVELLEMLMVAIVFLGMAPAVREGNHISVDLFREMVPAPMRRVGDAISALVSLVIYALIAYAGASAAQRSLAVGEYSNGPVAIPLFPARLALTAGVSLAALASLVVLGAALLALARRR